MPPNLAKPSSRGRPMQRGGRGRMNAIFAWDPGSAHSLHYWMVKQSHEPGTRGGHGITGHARPAGGAADAGGGLDLDDYEERLGEAGNPMVLAHAAMARTAVEARERLTPEQRARLALARSVMQEMRGGLMHGGMRPGMRQGHDPAGRGGEGH